VVYGFYVKNRVKLFAGGGLGKGMGFLKMGKVFGFFSLDL